MSDRIRRILSSVRLSSVILILIGAVLLVRPDAGSRAVILTLGWILAIAGGLGVAASVFSRMTFGYGTMGSSLMMLLLGVLILSRPMVLASLFGVVLGAYLVFSGLGSFADAGRLRSNGQGWILGMVWAVISVVAGVYLIISPMASTRFVMIVAGIMMIACGAGSIVTHAKLARFMEQQQNPFHFYDEDDDNIIDV